MVMRASTNPDDFCLPDLGEGLEEAELIEWCVHVGQRVEENQTLAKMETAKALVEVPSPRSGTIAELHGKPGEAIKVGAALVTYHAEAAGRAAASGRGNGHAKAGEPAPAAPAAPPERADAGTVVGSLGGGDDEQGEKVRAAPAVRRLARERGIDLHQVPGTGIGGRITLADVQAFESRSSPASEAGAEIAPTALAHASRFADEAPPPAPTGEGQRTPFRGVRKTIADHLRHSINHAIHYTVMDEADVSALDELRRRLMAASNEKITFLPFVSFAICRVLSGRFGEHLRRLNSTVDDEKQQIVQHRPVHLGVATDTESGLMVPVIRNAERMGVLEFSRQIAALARSARDRSIPANGLHGSTFTISNFGSMGGRFGTPIINYPEAAILAVGRAREGVVVRRGMLGVGRVLPLSLTCDHRVIDGATAATALAKIIELLQSPDELLPAARESG